MSKEVIIHEQISRYHLSAWHNLLAMEILTYLSKSSPLKICSNDIIFVHAIWYVLLFNNYSLLHKYMMLNQYRYHQRVKFKISLQKAKMRYFQWVQNFSLNMIEIRYMKWDCSEKSINNFIFYNKFKKKFR